MHIGGLMDVSGAEVWYTKITSTHTKPPDDDLKKYFVPC